MLYNSGKALEGGRIMREFNVTGVCNIKEHYMVDINGKLDEILKLIEKRKYFTINRARQYGKTTTIRFLAERLKEEYIVINTSFEGLDDSVFADVISFNINFIDTIAQILNREKVDSNIIASWQVKIVLRPLSYLATK